MCCYGALDSDPFILHRMMQCASPPEGPPSRCLRPAISVSPSAAGCGGQDIKDPYGIDLRSAPDRGVAPSGGGGDHPVCSALSGGPQQVDSTDHSCARLPATGGNHPQHRCQLLRECLCSTGPGGGAQRPEWSQHGDCQAQELFPTDRTGGA